MLKTRLQLREVQSLIRQHTLTSLPDLLGAVFMGDLSKQRKAWVFDAVAVYQFIIHNAYHFSLFTLHFSLSDSVTVLIIVIIAHLHVLENGDGVVGKGGQREVFREQIRGHTELVETHQTGT